MFRSKNKLSFGTKNKSSSLLTLHEIDELEKSLDWRKHYVVKPKEIGRGHFSKVYQVKREGNDKLYAAKVIRRRKGGIDRLEKIRKEAEIIKKLNDKNVMSVMKLYETFESFSDVVLICEFAKGGSLFNLVQESDKGLNPVYVKSIIYKMLLALESMHSENIVHLDIKADNILLREPYPSTNIAICDFGLATELKKGISHKELVGTPDYMAPEVINYEKITFNADMWSVGVLVYYLLTKISPFMGRSKEATLVNVSKVKLTFEPIFNQPEFLHPRNLISCLCVKIPGLRLTSSTAQLHDWFQNINIDNDQPPGNSDYSKSSYPDLSQSISDNLNNYNPDPLISSQRCQSMGVLPLSLNTNFHRSCDLQSNSTSYENIFFQPEEAEDNDVFDNHSDLHTSMVTLPHHLTHVDEDVDESKYESIGMELDKTLSSLDKAPSDTVVKDIGLDKTPTNVKVDQSFDNRFNFQYGGIEKINTDQSTEEIDKINKNDKISHLSSGDSNFVKRNVLETDLNSINHSHLEINISPDETSLDETPTNAEVVEPSSDQFSFRHEISTISEKSIDQLEKSVDKTSNEMPSDGTPIDQYEIPQIDIVTEDPLDLGIDYCPQNGGENQSLNNAGKLETDLESDKEIDNVNIYHNNGSNDCHFDEASDSKTMDRLSNNPHFPQSQVFDIILKSIDKSILSTDDNAVQQSVTPGDSSKNDEMPPLLIEPGIFETGPESINRTENADLLDGDIDQCENKCSERPIKESEEEQEPDRHILQPEIDSLIHPKENSITVLPDDPICAPRLDWNDDSQDRAFIDLLSIKGSMSNSSYLLGISRPSETIDKDVGIEENSWGSRNDDDNIQCQIDGLDHSSEPVNQNDIDFDATNRSDLTNVTATSSRGSEGNQIDSVPHSDNEIFVQSSGSIGLPRVPDNQPARETVSVNANHIQDAKKTNCLGDKDRSLAGMGDEISRSLSIEDALETFRNHGSGSSDMELYESYRAAKLAGKKSSASISSDFSDGENESYANSMISTFRVSELCVLL